MTESEAKGFIHGKLDCMNECGVFNREDIKKKDLCDNCDYCYSQGNFGQQREAFQIAINALEKQIPKKPVDKSKNPVDWHVMACPCCNNTFWNSGQFIRYQPKFCNYCGQAIDWSES